MQYFDVLIIAPLQEEVDAIFDHFPAVQDYTEGSTLIYSVETGVENVTALVVHPPDWGQLEASNTTRRLLERFQIGTVICVGIAGRLSDDLLLGDVCFSHRVYEVVDKAKVTDAGDVPDAYRLDFTPTTYDSARRIVSAFGLFRVHPLLKKELTAWQDICRKNTPPELFDVALGEKFGLESQAPIRDAPKFIGGPIVSAFVSTSSNFNKRLLEIDRKMLAIETESGGIFASAKDFDIPVVSIRGISDFADETKKIGEVRFKEAFRKVASHNAAAFLVSQFKNPHFLDALRVERARSANLPAQPGSAADFLSTQVKTSSEDIDANLRELSIEYRLQPKDFVLPAPRIVRVQDDQEDPERRERLEPIEVIISNHIVSIDVPRSYPDETAPWIVADHILRADRFNCKYVPYVVASTSVKGGNHTLDRAIGPGILGGYKDSDASTPVVILTDVDPLSTRRTKFLFAEMAAYPWVRFVLITKNGGHFIKEAPEFSEEAVACYELCEVSFFALTEFIRTTFRMTDEQADVVTYRLIKTFDHFDVVAHPTYFAGISIETLSALLQANRRSELIQLAVDGFLTFIVADDTATVTLSRSTRRRFLEALVVEMEVERRSFDLPKLLSFTKEFAKKHDFEISESEFITGFMNKLILAREGDTIRFGLPFIKTYLLASALSKDETLARRYFNFDDEDFDTSTFDLYGEISESNVLLNDVLVRLKHHRTRLSEQKDARSANYLSLNARPVLGFDDADSAEREVSRILKRMTNRAQTIQEKARILDFSRDLDVRLREAKKQDNPATPPIDSTETSAEIVAKVNPDSLAQRDWYLSVVLLGAAAERLSASEKRELIEVLIPLGRMLAVQETVRRNATDFDKVRADMFASDEFAETLASIEDESARKEIKELLEALLDFMEPIWIAGPFIHTLYVLCEEGRQRVLAKSLEAVRFEDALDETVRATWLIDLDSDRGADAINGASKKIGAALFLRALLASHFMTRIYWSHWAPRDRAALIEAVEAILPQGKVLRTKGKLQRLIAATEKKRGDGQL